MIYLAISAWAYVVLSSFLRNRFKEDLDIYMSIIVAIFWPITILSFIVFLTIERKHKYWRLCRWFVFF